MTYLPILERHAPACPSGRLVDAADRGRIERRTGTGTGAIRPACLLEGRPGEAGDPRLRARHHGQGEPAIRCRRKTASRPSIRTARCGSSIRSTRRRCSRSIACMRWPRSIPNGHRAIPSRRCSPTTWRAIAGFSERDWAEIVFVTHAGMSPADFKDDRREVAGVGEAPALEAALYRARLSADDRGAGAICAPTIRNLHRHRRRTGFRAQLCPARLRHPDQSRWSASSIATKYEIDRTASRLIRLPKLFFNDNDDGKAIGIELFIGKRPHAAFGNSTGDREMLEWTGAGSGARLTMLVYHDDAEREYAYGPPADCPTPRSARSRQALYDEAKKDGWTVISMKNDWKRIFAFDQESDSRPEEITMRRRKKLAGARFARHGDFRPRNVCDRPRRRHASPTSSSSWATTSATGTSAPTTAA